MLARAAAAAAGELLFILPRVLRGRHAKTKQNTPKCPASVTHTSPFVEPYRDIAEITAGVRCPDVFAVRIPNNGAILTAAIGHQVIHVALPRHAQEIRCYMYVLVFWGGWF